MEDEADVRALCLTARGRRAAADAQAASERASGGEAAAPTPEEAVPEAELTRHVGLMEDLLESYFSRLDSAHRALLLVEEQIGDTEEYINISLSSRRTNLIFASLIIGRRAPNGQLLAHGSLSLTPPPRPLLPSSAAWPSAAPGCAQWR